jgi:universal stress protein E
MKTTALQFPRGGAVIMNTIRRILVPIGDFRVGSRPVIDKAAQLAAAWGAEVELFHDIYVAVPVEALGTPGFSLAVLKSQSKRAALDALERLAAPLRARGLKVSIAAAYDYPPYEAIVRRALSTGADLIVVPRRDAHRLPAVLGYTDWELLRLSPVPVLLVKSSASYRRPIVLAAIDPTHAFAKPSGLDQRILEESTTFSHALHGSLHVVHAYLPAPLLPPPTVKWHKGSSERLRRPSRTDARQLFARALRKTAIPVSHRHLLQGDSVEVIAAAARKTHSAIVVMGAVSRSGLKRLFIGNTAEKVMDELRCDLLVVKPAHFACRIPRARRGIEFFSAALHA